MSERSELANEPRHGLVDTGLEALASVLPLDLCAHLDDAAAAAQLYLHTPPLAGLDPSTAYRLFADLRVALDKAGVTPGEPHAVEVDGITAVAVATATSTGRRVTVAGRRDATLSPTQVDAVVRLAHALAMIEPAPGAFDGPLRVSVELSAGTARAVVTVGAPGSESTGMSEAGASSEAVARASLEAAGSEASFQGVAEVTIGTERAVLVLVRRTDGSPALGSAIVGADPLHATASAALAAAAEATSG